MCRRDLNTDNFRGCQFPQSKCKEKSVGHLVSSCPSAPSGKTGAFSSSSASELSQLSDSSSKSARQMTKRIRECTSLGFLYSLDAIASLRDHFSPRHLMLTRERKLLISGFGQLSILLVALGALWWARKVRSAVYLAQSLALHCKAHICNTELFTAVGKFKQMVRMTIANI